MRLAVEMAKKEDFSFRHDKKELEETRKSNA